MQAAAKEKSNIEQLDIQLYRDDLANLDLSSDQNLASFLHAQGITPTLAKGLCRRLAGYCGVGGSLGNKDFNISDLRKSLIGNKPGRRTTLISLPLTQRLCYAASLVSDACGTNFRDYKHNDPKVNVQVHATAM